MYKRMIAFLLVIFTVLFFAGSALAQSYSFTLPKEAVTAIWNEDGTLSIDYVFVFQNDPGAPAIGYPTAIMTSVQSMRMSMESQSPISVLPAIKGRARVSP
jgi:hypothetical protein